MRIEKKIIIPQQSIFLLTGIQRAHEENKVIRQQDENKKTYEIPDGLNLLDQLLAVQRIKEDLKIESLAANWSGNPSWVRRQFAVEYAKKPTWWGFQKLRNELTLEVGRVSGNNWTARTFLRVMLEIVNKLSPDKIGKYDAFSRDFSANFSKFSNSTLMRFACHRNLRIGNFQIEVTGDTREYAAKILRTLIEKVGEGLSDEAEIINNLLNAPFISTRREGAIAVNNTYKHKWRKSLSQTSIISVLRKEENDEIRKYLAHGIALGNPKSILESWSVSGSVFRPIDRVLTDRSVDVRVNLSCGIKNLMLAQVYKGQYYSDFHEVPYLSTQDKIDCFDYSLRVLEKVYGNSYFNEADKALLENSSTSIAVVVNDRSVLESSDGQSLLNKLSQLDLIKFIRSISKFNFFSDVVPLVDKVLLTRAKNYDKPLVHYFSLRDDLIKLKQETSDYYESSRIGECIQKIDDSIEVHLINTDPKSIKWGEKRDFNFVISNLLEILESSANSHNKISILNLIESLHQDKVQLDSGLLALEDALDSESKLRLNKALTKIVYSSEPTKEFLTNPQRTSLEGRALLLYRKMTESFKDYFGMSGLKDKCVELALDSFQGKTNGLLLSGAAGAGKSSLAKVLANELALPLVILEIDKLKEDTPGNIIFQEGTTRLSLDKYLANLLQHINVTGACIVLIDNIEKIASPTRVASVISLSQFIQGLRLSKCKTLILATTNDPPSDSVSGMMINSDGSSEQINTALSQTVSRKIFGDLPPCYLFHERSVGVNFAREYLPTLAKSGKLKDSIDLPKTSKLSRGLSPASIIFSFSRIPTLDQESVIAQLKKLKTDNDYYIGYLGRYLRTKIDDLLIEGTHTLEGEINYFELALAAEEFPLKTIGEIIKNAPVCLNQNKLIELFLNYQVETMKDWMKISWKVLDRNPDLPYARIASEVLKSLPEINKQVKHLKMNSIDARRFRLNVLHEIMLKNRLWDNDTEKYSVKFYDLPYDMKLNYIALLLAASIAHFEANLLPATHVDLQDSARQYLEMVWRVRFPESAQEDNVALDWNNTTKIVLGHINKALGTHKSISDLSNTEIIREICKKVHSSMIENKLWGKDTSRYAVSYDNLEQHMKDNYVLITLCVLSTVARHRK